MTSQQAQEIFQLLKNHYPHAKMILEWGNNFELLVSIILSAQCTDKKVNEVTAKVFPKYRQKRSEFASQYQNYTRIELPKEHSAKQNLQGVARVEGPADAQRNGVERASAGGNKRQDPDSKPTNISHEEMVELVNFGFVPLEELEQDIKSTGFYHNKAVNVQKAARTVLDTFSGILPQTISELTTIPGVGRKTANVFLGNAYGIYEGIAVDTHVTKQSQILGFTKNTDPVKIEQDLMKLFPKEQWFPLTYLLIEHGRNMRRKKSDRVTCGQKECILCNQ